MGRFASPTMHKNPAADGAQNKRSEEPAAVPARLSVGDGLGLSVGAAPRAVPALAEHRALGVHQHCPDERVRADVAGPPRRQHEAPLHPGFVGRAGFRGVWRLRKAGGVSPRGRARSARRSFAA